MREGSGTLVPGTRIGAYVVDDPVHIISRNAEQQAVVATHVVLPRRVWIVTVGSPGEPAERLLREAGVLDGLRHRGVPRVYECGWFAQRPWVAMEIVEGTPLATLIARQPLASLDVAALIRDVAAILEHAHTRGVVHHGLRATSIVQRGDGYSVIHWCHAIAIDFDEVTALDDVRALGAVAYRALTRMPPTVSAARRCPLVSVRLTRLVDRMLAGTIGIAEVRREIDLVFEEVTRPSAVDDGPPVEEVEVVLVDISRDPPPIPRQPRWTPASSFRRLKIQELDSRKKSLDET